MDPHPAGARRPRWSPLALVLPLLWSEPVLGALSWGGSSSAPWAGPDAPWEQRLLDAEDLAVSLGPGGAPGTLPRDLPDLDPACRELLLDLARSSAELTGCLVRSARPVRICQACFPLFRQVVGKMDNISRAVEVRGGEALPGPWLEESGREGAGRPQGWGGGLSFFWCPGKKGSGVEASPKGSGFLHF